MSYIQAIKLKKIIKQQQQKFLRYQIFHFHWTKVSLQLF
ncbi:hypothetical protein IGI80_000023 [Enterococcus sp. DIV1420a]